jgi:hypothetical protein
MLLSRNIFLALLLCIFLAPNLGYKLYWLARSQQTTGVMCFTGHTLTSLGVSSHPVILFRLGRDTIFFNGNTGVEVGPGAPVPVRYRRDNPSDAKLDSIISLWGDTFVWALFPVLFVLVLSLTPERFDPLIPRKSFVRLDGHRPFIHIITKNEAHGYSLR